MSELMKKVSVIVPCYNAAEFLDKGLSSLLTQTLTGIEIICVNDASTDNTLEILRRYEQMYPNNVMVIDLKENQRTGGARNEALKLASGEYIGFMDQDDWAARNMFECLYSAADESGADIVLCGFYKIYEDSCEEYLLNTDGAIEDGALDDVGRERLILTTNIAPWNKIYKREFVMEHALLFPAHVCYEDVAWTPIVMAYAGSVHYIRQALYYHLQNPDSVSHVKNKTPIYDSNKVFLLLMSDAKRRGLYKKYQDVFVYIFLLHHYPGLLWEMFHKLPEIELDRLHDLSLYVRKNFPDYRQNPYFKHIWTYSRVIQAFLDADPKLAVLYLRLLDTAISN